MRRWIPEAVALPLYPVLHWQGRQTRRITPRLPPGAGECAGLAGGELEGTAIRLLAVGESPVAGVGVKLQQHAITAVLADTLAQRFQRPVAWRAHGCNGATVRDALQGLVPQIAPGSVDILLVAFGVNDSTAFHSVSRWTHDLVELLKVLETRCPSRMILLSGVPPLAEFPALPQPLRWVVGQKAHVLDQALQNLALRWPAARHVPLAIDANNPHLMARDGYHPSEAGCVVWAELLAREVLAEGGDPGA